MRDETDMTDAAARAILQHMRTQSGTLFRALDQDGDGILSADEIAAAPEVLKGLVRDADGCLRERDLGGPTDIPGMLRRSGIVRLLDPDGDLVITPEDIVDASARILRLDTDGDGCITAEDDLPDLTKNAENRMPMGTPKDRLAYQRKMFTRSAGITGPLPPGTDLRQQPGFLLIQEVSDRGDVQKSHKTILLDDMGEVAHSWPTPQRLPEATVTYLMANGNVARTTCEYDWLEMDGRFPIGTHGTVSIVAPDGAVLWKWSNIDSGGEALHHDIEVMPNGHILAISWHILDTPTAQAVGWPQQGERDRILLDKIIELKPDLETGETQIVWEWRMLDHLVQDRDPRAANFGDPAENIGKIDLNWPWLDTVQFNSGQIAHCNSVSYNAEEDVILLSSAIFGEAWVIDHSTTTAEAKGSTGGRYGKGGDLLWRWGNPQTHGLGQATDQILFWQHDAHFLPANVPHSGEILIFNNGMRRTPQGSPDPKQKCMGLLDGAYSDVLEITLPRDGAGLIEQGAPPQINWNFNDKAQHDIYSPFMSGAQRMPNGNTLMMQACDKRVVEVTASGEIVLDFHVGGPGRMFRIYKFASDAPGIKALRL